MATPFAKRRRLDQGAINKPFKSPFRTPNQIAPVSTSLASSGLAESNADNAPSIHATQTNIKSNTSFAVIRSRQVSNRALKHPAVSTEEAKHRELSRAITACCQDIDAVQQATSIIQKGSDDALEELVAKWRAATRLAAEEVYASARDRVNRMGGVGVWREREDERSNFWSNWDTPGAKDDGVDDVEYDENGEELGVAEREERTKNRKELREAMEEESKADQMVYEERRSKTDADGSETFTMDMMLRAMGIASDLVGWDQARQMWVG